MGIRVFDTLGRMTDRPALLRQRLHERPAEAENRLLVSNLNLAKAQHPQEVPIAPELRDFERLPLRTRFNNRLLRRSNPLIGW